MDVPDPDGPDEIRIGPIVVPIIEDDDPWVAEDRALWSAANATARAMHTWEELRRGMSHEDWRVRHESVVRISARWRNDPRTLPAILQMAVEDPIPAARDSAVMCLTDYPAESVRGTLERAAHDPDAEVRWSANYCLAQHGFDHEPVWPDDEQTE
ncbi:HEAT repeat domain-containing protein [Kribbella rubisoli]|uniref:HEAT repeat domain-containing protein n=1 Tax=Kribbella rubisoli TaxID=3075929 RepID=UPI00102C4276|nr:HEAT repeat domain-containing protein [Kribbella rubisoli]